MRRLISLVVLGVSFVPAGARAEDAGAPRDEVGRGCVEKVPEGARRPTLVDEAPARGTSGYTVRLRVTVEHGKGESVLPRGLELQGASETAKELRAAGFAIPEQDGSAGAELSPAAKAPADADRAATVLDLPLVALPPEPGRQTLLLPSLPIAVARANGDVMTLCTRPHRVMVDDATASTPNAGPKPNPAPRVQREEWTALKRAVEWSAAGLAVGAVLGWLAYRWSRRPKKLPPPPPPRPPWEVALEKLDEARHAGLLEVDRHGEYFDRVSDTLRQYLGARYGFDGLESTTDEIVRALTRSSLGGITIAELTAFLQECDLVKFAKVTPTPEECLRVLAQGEHIVRVTMPRSAPARAGFAEGRAAP